MPTEFDAIVIGAGQAGSPLAVRLAQSGRRTALIERAHLGGTCVNTGCMPTKTLVASARAAYVARRAKDWGVAIGGEVTIDWPAVRARKEAIVRSARGSLDAWVEGTDNLVRMRAEARFTGANTVEAGGEVLTAPEIFIDTGARPVKPAWGGLGQVAHSTSDDIMDLDALPDRLVIAGASYIGLEFAQIFRRFGVEVTVVDAAERPIAREDAEVSAEVRALLEAEGVAFRLGLRNIRLEPEGSRFTLQGASDEGPVSVEGDDLLVALGRRPNTDVLALDKAGVAVDARGYILVDDELRTSAPGVWALGEANGRGAFTHTAYNDYEIVAENLLDGARRRLSERIPAYALYTDPPFARVGMSETEARAAGREVLIGKMPMSRVGRAKERGETRGFMKALVDAGTGLILGAAFLGVEADEAIHVIITAMAGGMTAAQLRRAVFIHPTVSELIPTLLGELKPLADA